MADITLNTIGYADLKSQVAALDQPGVVAQVGELDEASNTTTLTITSGGKTTTLTVALTAPLDPPAQATEEQRAAELQSVADKITSTAESLQNASGGGFFDIYALMTQVLEIAQEQKKSALTQRQAQHELVKNTLQQQSKEILSAASSVYNTSMTAAWIQTGVSIGGAAMSAGGFAKQISSYNASEAGMAGSTISQAKVDLKTVQNAANTNGAVPQAITEQRLAGTFSAEGGVKESYAKLATTQSSVEAAEVRVQSAETNVTQKQANLAGAQERLTQARADNNAGAIETAEKDVQAKSTELNTALEDRQKAVDQLTDARAAHGDAIMDVKAKMDAEIKNTPKGAALDEKLTARKDFLAAEKTQQGIKDGLGAKIDKYTKIRGTEMKDALNSMGMKKGDYFMATGGAVTGIGTAGSQIARSGADYEQKEGDAEQKRLDAVVEGYREQLDVAKSAITAAQDMVRMVNETYKGIQQAESQSVQNILRA